MRNLDGASLLLFFGLGICPLLMGLAFFWGSGQINVITCRHLESTHVDCGIDSAFLGLIPSDHVTLTKVTGTELTTNCEDGSCTYAVELLTESDAVQLSGMATSDLDAVEEEQERIDNFLEDTDAESLEFSSGPAWIGMLLSIPFIFLGGYITTRGIMSYFSKKAAPAEVVESDASMDEETDA